MSLSLEFTSPPSAWTAYRRFLMGRRQGLKNSADMPKIAASWKGVEVSEKALNDYREACLITGEPGLPVHYPHVLVSPMHLNMLTEPEFPLGLLGAVHLRNHAIRYRPIEPDEPLDFGARIAECRFRPQGIEFDMDTEVTVAQEKVWAERTTFLVRKKLKTEDPASPLAEVFPWPEEDEDAGEEIGCFPVPAKAGKRYAAITGDYNPIHVSRMMAKLFGFRRDLVHGLWGVARATQGMPELNTQEPVRVDIAFKGPLFMEHQVSVKAVDCPGGRSLRLFCGKEPRPAVQVVVRSATLDSREQFPPVLASDSGGIQGGEQQSADSA